MADQQLAFTHVAVAGAPAVVFCVDREAGDPLAARLLDNPSIDEPGLRAFLDLVEPGTRVLDLGSNLGVFSLPAAALGAEVIAVDGSPSRVARLRMAADRNGFERLQVVHGAVADGDDPVAYIERGIHARAWVPGDPVDQIVDVPRVAPDAVLERHGWDRPDVVRMDLRGAEPSALRGLRRTFARGSRPHLVFECNDVTLTRFDTSISELQHSIAELGYELLLVDELRPGTLVETRPGSVQPQVAADYLGLASHSDQISNRWVRAQPFDLEETVALVLHHAAADDWVGRRYCAGLLTRGPDWLRRHPLADAALRALAHDPDEQVRDAAAPTATLPRRRRSGLLSLLVGRRRR